MHGLITAAGRRENFKLPDQKYLRKRVWHKYLAFFRYPYAIYHHPDYAALLKDFAGDDPELKDLPIPYSTLALDLNKQQLLSINNDTHPTWKASKLLSIATAIPPMFSPIGIDNMLLVDGGVASESPGWVAAAESEGRPVVVLKNSAGLTDKLNYFMEEAEKQNVRIFPISVSRIENEKNPLHAIQFVNDPESPLDEMSNDDQHTVLSNMVQQLIAIMRQHDEKDVNIS